MEATVLSESLDTRQERPRHRAASATMAQRIWATAQSFSISKLALADILGISQSTLNKRLSSGTELSPSAWQRADRLRVLLDLALDTLEKKSNVSRWLEIPNVALAGSRPISILTTEEGVRRVETVLYHIAYGVYS